MVGRRHNVGFDGEGHVAVAGRLDLRCEVLKNLDVRQDFNVFGHEDEDITL